MTHYNRAWLFNQRFAGAKFADNRRRLTSSRNVDMLARMSATINTYLKALDGYQATEHSHRPALKALFEAMMPDAQATNEPRRIECGAPDFVIHRKEIPFGYAETKNIGANLDDAAHRAQIKRYSDALDNLIFTDYLTFRLIREGAVVAEVCIGELRGGKIKPLPQNFEAFVDLIKSFADYQGLTITTADELAQRMAHKARMLASVIEKAIDKADDDNRENLNKQLKGFSKHLMHDITAAQFADIYAQTIAYGMFAARLHDSTAQPFTRKKAAELIPLSNPFLRKFFQYIAGYDLDDRIIWVVDDLADLFCAADVGELMKDYGRQTARGDPFIHFYETFLGEYDPAKRKSRGVYYTPEPVVNFIVRAVDELLRDKFKLAHGIADSSRVPDKKQSRNIHKVQILDPATGTGTFLASIVKHIADTYYAGQKGAWQSYVNEHLIPRLNGFELLMAAYSMAHIKLEMVLRDSGCAIGDERLRVFLTNALEEQHSDTETLFASWLSDEAKEANAIKRETPVMVVIGNPPYAVSSSNKGEWIKNLIDAYKKDLNEQNIVPLSDDYIKFIRYGEHLVQRTGEGVLAYISNNSFVKGVIHRQMRRHLMETFDEIYILDLHGNSRMNETAPDGSVDENVFDIMQGVSINLFVKTGNKKADALASIFHFDLYGKCENKYQFLNEHNLNQVQFQKLASQAPQYLFASLDYDMLGEYNKGFSMQKLFPVHSSGVKTHKDRFTIYLYAEELQQSIAAFRQMDDERAREKYALGKDARDWKVHLARQDLEENVFNADNDSPVPICYRPFDKRYTYYTGKSKGYHSLPRKKVMRHFIDGENTGLITVRGSRSSGLWNEVFVANTMISQTTAISSLDAGYLFPLYTTPPPNFLGGDQSREPNLNPAIVKTIADSLGLRFVVEKQQDDKQQDAKTFAPIDLLDYIYAVLHSPAYREKYIEFLKIDFPRVPYPTDKNQFRKLVALGGQLREVHLMQSDQPLITEYNHSGDNKVGKINWKLTDLENKLGEVHINKNQRFEKVPATAWDFYIGGYQPAQKWLKDRKGIALTADDIRHWQKIIVALSETEKLMATIDSIQFIQ